MHLDGGMLKALPNGREYWVIGSFDDYNRHVTTHIRHLGKRDPASANVSCELSRVTCALLRACFPRFTVRARVFVEVLHSAFINE